MSRTAKIALIIFLIALAIIVYFILFGNKNSALTGSLPGTTSGGLGGVLNNTPVVRDAGDVVDPAQRYIGSSRPGVIPKPN